MKKLHLIGIRASMLVLLLASTQAWPANWDNFSGGSYDDPSNWSPVGVPQSTENIVFDLGASALSPYTVTFSSNVTQDYLEIYNDAVNLDLGGQYLNLTHNTTNSNSRLDNDAYLGVRNGTLILGNPDIAIPGGHIYVGLTGNGVLDIRNNSSVLSFAGATLGNGLGSTGSATVDGIGSSWVWNAGGLMVGRAGSGLLTIQNGAYVSGGSNRIGFEWQGVGAATVDGIGSTWNSNGGLFVGYYGTGTLNVRNGGTVSSSHGSIGSQAGSNGIATINGTGSTWTMSASLGIGGGPVLDGGTGILNVQNGGTVNVGTLLKLGAGSTLNLDGGTITASSFDASSGTFNFNGGVLTVDNFTGDLVNNGGTLAPGNSPGLTNIFGDYRQSIDGAFAVEVGGIGLGEYDVLDVSGTATLAGILDVNLLSSGLFTPGLGDSFDILLADTIIGEFDILSLAGLGAGLDWDLSYLLDDINTDIVRLSVVQAVPVPAAIWLFGSGIIGLVGITRRKKAV